MTVKKLLLILLFSICAIGWRSESVMQMIGLAGPVVSPQPVAVPSHTVPGNAQPAGMSLTQYAELARTDPDAYRKLLVSHQQQPERSEVDKLMNFFTRLKYE